MVLVERRFISSRRAVGLIIGTKNYFLPYSFIRPAEDFFNAPVITFNEPIAVFGKKVVSGQRDDF